MIWSTVNAGARAAVGRGWFAQTRLGPRVISVGNIQAGGAGKTPLVARIAREAVERGKTVAILSRGYGGEWERDGGVLRPGDRAPDPRECGDEPALLKEKVPEAWIGVGANRVAQFRRIEKEARIDLVVLDDGFQHWKIARDVEVVAVTSHGPADTVFRESASSLARAQLVVWTKGETRPDPRGARMVHARYVLPPAPATRHWLVTGVADPAEVARSLRSAGYRIEREIRFRDHARYSPDTVLALVRQAREAGCTCLITGKDWVKWKSLGVSEADVRVVEPELEIDEEGRELWERVLWGS